MTKATLPFYNRIALIFDFDETLAPDTFTALLKLCGLDPDWFEESLVSPSVEAGWNKMLARFYHLIQLAHEQDDLQITQETMVEVGKKLELYPEVTQMFDRVRGYAQGIIPDIEVEFYLLTAGMLEIPRATAVAKEFRMLWGGELFFDDGGELAFVKNTVSNSDKIKYILKLCKGMNIDSPKIEEDVFRHIPEDEWHVPLGQIVYVGDGDSDMPVFDYLEDNDGLAIAVFQGESTDEWEGYEKDYADREVQNLARSDFREDAELMKSIKLAVESIAHRIKLQRMGQDE